MEFLSGALEEYDSSRAIYNFVEAREWLCISFIIFKLLL